ncbi:MAG: hypothetical protein H8D67_16830 [Deltaproteobacteria bacterium]|nr:hypothetical protein [Deltaproteobacteria bacterium]
MKRAINIIFDGPPSHESGRFVEVETDDGKSINAGKWVEREDGLWALRITELPDGCPQPGVEAEAEIRCPKCGETEPVLCCENCGHKWT